MKNQVPCGELRLIEQENAEVAKAAQKTRKKSFNEIPFATSA
jgi:hypothetical protein